MDFSTYLIQVIKRAIPREVLDLALVKKSNSFFTSSLDQEIRQKVLNEFFYTDLSLLHGVEIIVPGSDLELLSTNDKSSIVRVPQEYLGGRTITTALAGVTSDLYPVRASNTEDMLALRLQNNLSGFMYTSTAKIDVIGPDEILIYNNSSFRDMSFKFLLNYSKDFNEINQMSFPKLSIPVILAAKAVIYNKLIVAKGESYLFNGSEMPIVDSIIDKYEDALDEYMEKLPTTKKILFMDDAKSMNQYINSLVSNNI